MLPSVGCGAMTSRWPVGQVLRFEAGVAFKGTTVPCPMAYGNTSWKKTLFWVGSKGTQT